MKPNMIRLELQDEPAVGTSWAALITDGQLLSVATNGVEIRLRGLRGARLDEQAETALLSALREGAVDPVRLRADHSPRLIAFVVVCSEGVKW